MSLTDPLGDMLTRIRNAYGRNKSSCSTPASRCAPVFSTC
jgi:small subunit ribosomal protein S8